jgi:hypothetical protein
MRTVSSSSPRHRVALSLATLAVAALGGCGRTQGSVVSTGERPVRVNTTGGTFEARVNDVVRAAEAEVRASPARVWAVLPGVFGELGLAYNGIDDRTRQLELRAVRVRGRLGKARLSSYLSCGTSLGSGGSNADMYDIVLNVASKVTAGADTTTSRVSTVVTASARPVAVSGSEVTCSTTGNLEDAIGKLTMVRAGAG